MEKYNLGMKQEKSCKFTIAELCNEIADENKEMNANSQDTLRDKFKNNDKSGLIDKLYDVLNFRIEEFEDKFAQLKVLKYLYYIEKNGQSKEKCLNESYRLRIIDILNKPRLNNIDSKTEYGEILIRMKEDISIEIEDQDIKERNDTLIKINSYWEHILAKTLDYVIAEMSNERKDGALIELERIENFLDEKILKKMPQDIDKLKIKYSEGLFQVFYNRLLCHEFLCMEEDRLNINYQICMENGPSEEYITMFLKYENYIVNIDEIIKKLSKSIDDDNCEDIKQYIFMIWSRTEISKQDKLHLKSALKYIKVLIGWLGNVKKFDTSESIYFSIFISVLQEIIFVIKNKEKFKNDFYGNKYQARSMLAALKNPTTVDTVTKLAWIKKVENRNICNIGAIDNLKVKMKIENNIYKIKSNIFKYQNLSDIEGANNLIIHFVARTIISSDLAMKIGNDFANLVYKKCGYTNFFNENDNVLNLYKELLFSEETMKKVALDMGMAVLEYEAEEPEQKYIQKYYKGIKYDFSIKLNQEYDKNFLLMYDINFKTKTIILHSFYEISPDEETDNLIKIGLNEFIMQ